MATTIAPECDLFTHPALVNSYSGYSEILLDPESFQPTYPGIISFKVSKSETEFTSSDLQLRTTLRIRKRNADNSPTALVAEDNIALDSCGINGVFSNVEVRLNGVVIESHNNHFQTTSFLKKLLGTSEAVKPSLVQSCGFSPGTSPIVDTTDDANVGRLALKNQTNLSRLVTYYTTLETDFSTFGKLIPPNVDISLILTHACEESRTHGPVDTAFVEILSCQLSVQRYILEPSLSSELARRLSAGDPIHYAYTRLARDLSRVRTPLIMTGVSFSRQAIAGPFEIQQGASNYRTLLSSARMPMCAIVFLRDSDCATSRTKSIYNFKNNNVKMVCLESEGYAFPPYPNSLTDFSVSDPIREKRGAIAWFNR